MFQLILKKYLLLQLTEQKVAKNIKVNSGVPKKSERIAFTEIPSQNLLQKLKYLQQNIQRITTLSRMKQPYIVSYQF